MLDAQQRLKELDAVLAALAHEARRHILLVVWFRGGAMSAGDIAGRFGHTWPTTSRHLRVLEEAGLLRVEKRGRTRFYRVNHEKLQVVRDWLKWFERQEPQGDDSSATPSATDRAETLLRGMALAYPETHEDFPRGQCAIKVRNRNFLFLRADEDGLTLSVRLPLSGEAARKLPFTEIVRGGWITARLGPEDELPLETMRQWIDESYRAVAPKRLVAELPPSR